MAEGEHDLDLSQIDELDEIDGDEQHALVWCDTHQKYEWHWVPRKLIGQKRTRRFCHGAISLKPD